MPEISVIIPMYNREKSIRAAIESVLSQTFSDFEIIAVDDGSTDGTVDVVNSIHDERLRLIKLEKNSGAQAARNAGITVAKSPWIAFLDSDDLYLPDSLQIRYTHAVANNLEVVHSECLVRQDDSDKAKIFKTIPLSGHVYTDLLRKPGPTFPALFVSKKALLEIGLLDSGIKAYQEWDTSIRLSKKFPFGYVSRPTFIYQISTTNSISKNYDKGANAYLHIVNKYEDDIVKTCGPATMADHYAAAATMYHRARNKRDAKKYLRMAFQLNKKAKYYILAVIIALGIPMPGR